MTFRLTFAAVALAALTAAGCGSDGSVGAADADGIADSDPLDQFAYAAGFQQGTQYLSTDSSFNYDRFVDGFEAGLRGDSAEVAYAAGLQLGFDLAQDSLDVVNKAMLLAGVRAALAQEEQQVSDERFAEVQEVFGDTLFIRGLRAEAATDEAAAERLRQVQTNTASADSFLTAVRGRDGVERVADGVYSVTTTPGTGASPQLTDRVEIRYTGRFPNGTVFDESGDNPTTLGVNQVVPGFRDALLAMQVGESRTVFIAPAQAYGLRGQQGPGGQGGIPPNQALEFDIELVEIVPAQAMPPQMQMPMPGQ